MISIQFAILISISLFSITIHADNTLLGCYSSLPSSFKLVNTYSYQSSSYCSDECSGYAYFALNNHANCYCGNTQPDSSNTANTCNTYCYGYNQEMCGGESSFSVYSTGNQIDSDTSSSSSSSSLSSSRASVSALNSQVDIQATSSSTNSHPTGGTSANSITTSAMDSNTDIVTSPITSITSDDQQASTSVVFSTTFHTEGGSTIFVTNTITKSAIATATGKNGTTTNDNANTTNGSNKKKTNVGAIVGGVVGGVVGAIAIAIIALFGVRHYNMKKEEDRMEKEYQEAIKPVEYNPNNNIMADTLSVSSHGSFDANNKEDGMFRSSGSTGNFNNIRNESVPKENTNDITNPFDDSKRISTGSVFTGQQLNNKTNVLTVVNPDQD